MYNVVMSFGNYPTRLRNGKPGPHTEEELGLMWIRHAASISALGMLKKYRLVLLLPREVLIPDLYNLDLDQWGDKKRFDENNKSQPWPVGQNMNFKQILWFYAHNKLEGPFLWCEPDCIPVKATWLDDLFNEYERAGKPFMGALVEAFTMQGNRVPKHMTGNAIYPDKAYKLAPALLECHGTAWDVYAANQILKPEHFHQTQQIQHVVSEADELQHPSLDRVARLYHPDKAGNLIRQLSGGPYEQSQSVSLPSGKPLVEVLGEYPTEPPTQDPSINELLAAIDRACFENKDVQKKVAYFMLDHGIVNSGHWGQHLKRQRKAAAHAESPA